LEEKNRNRVKKQRGREMTGGYKKEVVKSPCENVRQEMVSKEQPHKMFHKATAIRRGNKDMERNKKMQRSQKSRGF
jgi:hypothetical protein